MPQIDQDVRLWGGTACSRDRGQRRERGAPRSIRSSKAGASAIAPPSFEEGVAKLEELAEMPVVFVQIDADPGPALDRLLGRLNADAAAFRRSSLVCVPLELIDAVAARAPHPGVMLLPDAADEERAAALGVAIASASRSETMLREEGGGPIQLLQLSEEVGRIARTLAALSGGEGRRGIGAPGSMAGEPRTPNAGTVRAWIRARRLRDQFFPAALFADPAWDMMLDLYAARLEGRAVAVSSLCIAAAVPPTTALRWMKQLVEEVLFVRIADPRDGRRVFIELSAAAADGLAGYFEAIGRIGFAVP